MPQSISPEDPALKPVPDAPPEAAAEEPRASGENPAGQSAAPATAAEPEVPAVPAQAPVPPAPAEATGPAAGPEAPAAPAPAPAPAPAAPAPVPMMVVRFGLMRRVGLFRHSLDKIPPHGTKVVIRTERGVEMGEFLAMVGEEDQSWPTCLRRERLQEYVRCSAGGYPLRREGVVLRLANHQDIVDHRHLESSAREEAAFCGEQILQLKLPMKVVAAEHLLGGERIAFYFCAESRVDFRELVRRLAGEYRTRVELRQVGARDEARLVADYERCGLRCCCQEFLKDLHPVSMRMAKMQKATLDPSKISGRCGRLMCCLRYEDDGYEELRQKLPRRNTWVRTAERVGRVVETQILTQLVRLELADRSQVVVSNEEIVQRDVAPVEMAVASEARTAPRASEKAPPRLLRDESAEKEVEGESPAVEPPSEAFEAEQPEPAQPRTAAPPGQAVGGRPPQPHAGGGGQSGRRRGRRRSRRRHKPGGPGGGPSAPPRPEGPG